MTWHSIPHEPRKIEATEARLDAIYAAARKGLKGDTLALAAGLLPARGFPCPMSRALVVLHKA